MKRKLYLLLSLLLLTSIHAAATPASLSIEDFSIKAGETKEMLIDLNSPDADITLVQFDLRLPEGLSVPVVDGFPAVDIAGRTNWRNHSLETNEVGGALRVLLYSSRNSTIPGTSGALISVTLQAAATFSGGDIVLGDILLVTPELAETKPADLVYTIEGKVAVSAISLSQTMCELQAGSSVQLTATVYPANATDQSVRWSSNNSAVATVSSSGLVTAVAAGNAVITCEAQDGSGVKAVCVVTVKQSTVLITSITLNASTLELAQGEQFLLVPTITPSNATNKTLTWDSSGDSIVKVSNNGLVTALNQGSAVVTCMAIDGSDVWALCRITVKAAAVSNAIQFADAEVKRICVQNWDTNGDGELSKDEAAAVKSIGTVFKKNSSISTFDELSLFTGLESIPYTAFSGCTNLRSVKIPASVTRIGGQAFYDCLIENLVIPMNVTYIEQLALSCDSLKSLTFENNKDLYIQGNTIGSRNKQFTNLRFPKGLQITSNPLATCRYLERIELDSDNPNLCVIDGVLFSNDKQTVWAYPNAKGSSYDIPEGTVSIGNDAFHQCYDLHAVTIPRSVTTIGSGAFSQAGLRTLTIPENVVSIGNYAFNISGGLNTVVSEIRVPFAINDNVFHSANYENATLNVPAGSKQLYQQAAGWKNFQNIVEVGAPAEPKLVLTKLFVDGDNHVAGQHTIYFSIRNDGGDFNDYVYIYMKSPVSGSEYKSGDVWSVPSGFEQHFGVPANLTSVGTYRIWVATGANGENVLGETEWTLLPMEEEKGYTLVMRLKDGSEERFVLKDRPMALPSGSSQLTIGTMALSVTYERADIEQFYFLDKDGHPSGIKAVAEAEAGLTVRQLSNGRMQVSGLADGDAVRVFDLSGRLLNTLKADGSNALTVDLSQQPKGVYIININNKRTIKLQVK